MINYRYNYIHYDQLSDRPLPPTAALSPPAESPTPRRSRVQRARPAGGPARPAGWAHGSEGTHRAAAPGHPQPAELKNGN